MTDRPLVPLSFLGKFLVLRGAVRELWIIFGVKALAILAYGLVNSTLVLWLSSDLGLSDVKAGLVVATWSMVMTLATVLVGSLADAVGVRKAFLLGLAFCVFSRAVMSFSTMLWMVLPLGLFPLAIGEALQTPVLVAAVKRYSTTAQRSMAFAVYYSMYNVGFALAGWSFDQVRSGLGEYGHYSLPLLGASLSTYQVIILLGCLTTVPVWVIVYFGLRKGVEVTDEGVRIAPEKPTYVGESPLMAAAHSCRGAFKDWLRVIKGTIFIPARQLKQLEKRANQPKFQKTKPPKFLSQRSNRLKPILK